jgi:hypothetical protein
MDSPDDPLFPAQDMERGYGAEIVQSVWETAQMVPGNDPQVWRRDESGAWIHRLAYRNRRSEFGWEIADCAYTLRAFGLAALRPMQWQNYLDFLVASRSSVVTADGLRNVRKLL